ncbi:MAG: LysR substrate-binding domain-containing protein [Pikeienuella sp.]
MAVTLPRMRALNAVAKTGSFSAAARLLGLSQPAVAQQIRDLQQGLGVALFLRAGVQMTPTPICAELCAVATQFEEAESAAQAIVSRRHALVDGCIAIGLGNAMPGMAVIAEFHRRYPGVSYSIVTGSYEEITRAVVSREVDIGVLPNLAEDSRFRREVLLRHRVVALLPPDSRLAAQEELTCRDLMTTPLIFRARGSSTQRVVERAFRAAGLEPRPLLVVDTRDAVYEAVSNRLGVGFLWEHGTMRRDGMLRRPVAELSREYDEAVFAPADDNSLLCREFFRAARACRAAPTVAGRTDGEG